MLKKKKKKKKKRKVEEVQLIFIALYQRRCATIRICTRHNLKVFGAGGEHGGDRRQSPHSIGISFVYEAERACWFFRGQVFHQPLHLEVFSQRQISPIPNFHASEGRSRSSNTTHKCHVLLLPIVIPGGMCPHDDGYRLNAREGLEKVVPHGVIGLIVVWKNAVLRLQTSAL